MGRLDGPVAIITGASRGMGAAGAKQFVAERAQVVMSDVLEAVGQALTALPVPADPVPVPWLPANRGNQGPPLFAEGIALILNRQTREGLAEHEHQGIVESSVGELVSAAILRHAL